MWGSKTLSNTVIAADFLKIAYNLRVLVGREFATAIGIKLFDCVPLCTNPLQKFDKSILDLRFSLAKIHTCPPCKITRKRYDILVSPKVGHNFALQIAKDPTKRLGR
jgi:hypothetical protein